MEDLLQGNLMYLYEHRKAMFDQLQSYMSANSEKNCKVAYNEDGIVNLSYALQDEVKLLYAEDGNDIDQWMKENNDLAEGNYDVVMYGLGLSHHLAQLIQLNSELNFYILEPEIDIFIEALKVVQIDQLLNHPQVKMLQIGNSEEDMGMFYTLLHTYSQYAKIDVFIPFYAEVNIEVMQTFYKYNYSFREIEAIKIGFESVFGTLPYRNSIRNLVNMYCSCSLSVLKNKFVGCTALVVGSGPSLELDVEEIKRNRDKLLIISAGSSIQALLHNGIQPHLSVSMDPGAANGRVFERINTEKIPIVYVAQIYVGILEQNFQQKYYTFFNNDPIIDYLMPDLDPGIKMQANNSVTGTAIQVAQYLGASTIMFAGQDLSFPNNQYYAAGAQHTSPEYLKSRVNESFLEVENVNGSTNRTNLSIRSTLEDIESLIAVIPGVKFINTSSLGAKIKGADYIPFLEAIKDVVQKHEVDDMLNVSTIDHRIEHLDGVELLRRLEHAVVACDQLTADTKAALRLIDKIDQMCRMSPDKAMNSLVKLEQQFSQVTKHALFKTIIPAWNHSLTKKYDRQVIKIEAEPTMIGKAKLLREIVAPYMKGITISFNELKQEFQEASNKLKESMTRENR